MLRKCLASLLRKSAADRDVLGVFGSKGQRCLLFWAPGLSLRKPAVADCTGQVFITFPYVRDDC
jgi:hypothetical protein